MSEGFDEALAGIAAALGARLAEAEASGLTHLPRPVRNNMRAPVHVTNDASSSIVAKPNQGSGDRTMLDPSAGPQERLTHLEQVILGDCSRCKLHRSRTNIVFGVGSARADLVFVGEGPGGEEDRQGEPFVGKAGQLLTKMIGAMGLSREDVYICNVVKCRPPNNRDPQADEVAACEPFLKQQLATLSPKVIVTLGRYATQTLLQQDKPMGQLRGTWASYEGIPVMPTFHPAYLLRSPLKKREVWVDLQEVMARLGLQRP